MRTCKLLTLVLSVISIYVFPLKAFANSDFQSWNAIALAGPIDENSPWQFWYDGHYRFKDDANSLGVQIYRPAIGYQVNEDLAVWLGYARVISDAGEQNIHEDRIWQQATFNITQLFGGVLSGRTRLEQRFRDDIAGDTGHRIRQFFRWSKPLADNWSIVVWDELFIGLNDADWGQLSGFDQNRLYVGPAYQLSDKWRVEAGYMHNVINPPGGDNNRQTNHNLSITLFGSW
jgi:hypothetical protein